MGYGGSDSYDDGGYGGGGGSDDDDDFDGSSSTSTSSTRPSASSPTPPPAGAGAAAAAAAAGITPTPTPVVLDILVILETYSNGDASVSYLGTLTKICHPTPLPSAHETVHKEGEGTWIAMGYNTWRPGASSDSNDGISYGKIIPSAMPESDSSSSRSPSSINTSSLTQPSMNPTHAQATSPADQQPTSDSHPSHPPIGAIVVVPLGIIVALIAAFIIWRRKRKVRRAAAGMTQEMKMTRSPEEGLPQYTPVAPSGTPVPLMSSGLASTATGTSSSLTPAVSTAPSLPASATAEPTQPVILNSNMQSAYFTGIDTSDAMSTTSASQANNVNVPGNRMSYDARSMNSSDEPPPPYRPRSVPPISRETSLRQPNAPANISQMLAPLSEGTLSSYEIEDFRVADGMRNPFDGDMSVETTSLEEGMNNPFDDPDDESIVSDMTSTPVSPLVGRDEGGHAAMSGEIPTRPGRADRASCLSS